jgi:hypothetical protein
MKKILLLLLVISIENCFSATGNASDGDLVALSVLVIIAVILGTGYFVDFLKRAIKTAVTKKRKLRNNTDEEVNKTFFHENATLSGVFRTYNL